MSTSVRSLSETHIAPDTYTARLVQRLRAVSALHWCAVLIVGGFIIIASLRLNLPGPQYDELSFVNTALGAKYDAFAEVRIWGIPVVILPYVGALKSFVFYPLFALFGVSTITIRLFSIVIAAMGLYWFYGAMRLAVARRRSNTGCSFALLCLALLVFDPSLIGLVRLDVGPVAIEFFCKCLSLYLFYRILHEKRLRLLAGLMIVMAIGMYNKLNFIWFINSFTAAALVAYFPEIKRLYVALIRGSRSWQSWVILASGYGSFAAYYVLIGRYFHLKSAIGPAAISKNWHVIKRAVPETITGQNFFRYLFDQHVNSRLSSLYFYCVCLLLLAGLAIFAWFSTKKPTIQTGRPGQLTSIPLVSTPYRKLYIFSWVAFITALGQIIITPEALNPWHYFTIYPFVPMLVALSIYFVYVSMRALAPSRKQSLTIALGVVVLILSYQIYTYGKYVTYYSSNLENWYWSEAFYDLRDTVKPYNHPVVSVDWGTHTQLLSFDNTPSKYREVWMQLNQNLTPIQERRFAETYFYDPHTIFITYNTSRKPQASSIVVGPWPGTTINFLKVVADTGYHPKLFKNITNSNGQVVYVLYTVSSEPTPPAP